MLLLLILIIHVVHSIHSHVLKTHSLGESGWFSGHQGSVSPTSVTRVQLWPRVVCGLSFSRSQSDSEGFSPDTLVFLPPQNRLPAYSIRLWCCAPRSYMGRGQGPSALPAAQLLRSDLVELRP